MRRALILLGVFLTIASPLTAFLFHLRDIPAESAKTAPSSHVVDALDATATGWIALRATYLALDDADVGLLVIARQAREPTSAELDALSRHAERGGAILVLGDAPAAAHFGFTVAAPPIRDARAGSLAALDVKGNAWTLGPAGHAVLGAGTTLLRSPDTSYADVDNDGAPTPEDAAGPFPLAVEHPTLPVTVVGSDLSDARAAPLLERLLVERASTAPTIIDASRDAASPVRDASLAAALVLRVAPALQGTLLAGALLTAVAIALPALRRSTIRGESDPDPPVPIPQMDQAGP